MDAKRKETILCFLAGEGFALQCRYLGSGGISWDRSTPALPH